MRPPTRPRSASSGARRRPRSANPPALTPKKPDASRSPATTSAETMRALQTQCTELKCTTNTLAAENTKMRTRLMALERELQKREKLLQQMVLLNKAGQGVGMDVIEKLREERNMLPLLKRRAQDLQLRIEEKDLEIKGLKRDPQFTRIIELQVEYASWQHEARRLSVLLQEASPGTSEAAQCEVEIHQKRADKLEESLQKAGEMEAEVKAELSRLREDQTDLEDQHTECEEELTREQDATRELAMSFKELLQKRKQVEALQEEIDDMALRKRQYEEELAASAGADASGAERRALGRASVSQAVLLGPLPSASPTEAASLWTLRRAFARCSGPDSLFAQLLRRDEDLDGLVSSRQLAEALGTSGISEAPDEAAAAWLGRLPMSPAAGSGDSDRSGGAAGAARCLDLLVALDRLGGLTGPSPPAEGPAPLPDLRPLRAACLRLGLGREELRQRLQAGGQAEAFFGGLGLEPAVRAAWVRAWRERGGADGLLLRLPLSEVAPSDGERRAWFSRCSSAVHAHLQELEPSFATWRADLVVSEEQCRMVCNDVMPVELSQDDVDDLALWAGGGGEVDGRKVLKLAEAVQ
mmetsp:Transcript_11853/g.26276  ORF Transcript_11853/g.26276 Transcript_11853/m.26276 type:complete len:584 (-) Transcript_11853:36-1787(-)